VILDEYVVMPNHLHGILIFQPESATSHNPDAAKKALSAVICAFKSLAYKEWLQVHEAALPDTTFGKLWQRNYYEHVIRDAESHHKIHAYIQKNPANWQSDEMYRGVD